MSDHKIPFGVALKYCAALCAFFWAMTFLFPIYVGVAALLIGTGCGGIWLIKRIRQAFTFGSRDLADFVRGKGKSKPVENPLMLDPFYASIEAQITEAKARHRRVKHLYAKREHRVNELLGMKGAV